LFENLNAVKKGLRRLLAFTFCWLISSANGEWTGPFTIKQVLRSPAGSQELVIVTTPSPLGPSNPPIELVGKLVNGNFVEAKNLAQTVYIHESHGFGWLLGQQQSWINDRFVWAQDNMGIFIADAETNTVLVNDVLAGYSKSPTTDEWAAIRFRATPRTQPLLGDDFDDTLLLLDPQEMATAAAAVSGQSDSLAHIKAVKPGGVVLAKPEWSPDGSAFAVLTWKRGAVEAVRYDGSLNETARTPINIQVDHDSALSLSFKPELTQTAKNILSDPTTFSTASASVSAMPDISAREARQQVETPVKDRVTGQSDRDSKHWRPTRVALVIVGICILSAFLVPVVIRRRR
jgi:hypothetical protein